MGLYLCVFADEASDDDLDGVEIGGYDDFHTFRQLVAAHVEDDEWGSRCPALMNHADSDGAWTVQDCVALRAELDLIDAVLRTLPPLAYAAGTWQASVARDIGLTPSDAAQSLIDVDGEPLIERLKDLADLAVSRNRPITFM